MRNIYKQFKSQIIGLVICLVLGMISGYLSRGGNSIWYINLNKPSFNPPKWIFGPVWTILYIMMGIALGKIWDNRNNNKPLLSLFIIQLICNLAWSPIFFYFQRIDFALYDIILLWMNLFFIILISLFRKERIITTLLTPYFLWVSFAAILNLTIYQLNF